MATSGAPPTPHSTHRTTARALVARGTKNPTIRTGRVCINVVVYCAILSAEAVALQARLRQVAAGELPLLALKKPWHRAVI
mmetsp:Transcript_13146/g.33588  ORF Transcript_13146/g.33588 Transcript_13146/m.33588 type:complete len:81 (-) Transcript_13146:182-424(-)